ncbi:MAG: aminoglycoside phosphotransferase family protein, partial [Myxococcota bacterium]
VCSSDLFAELSGSIEVRPISDGLVHRSWHVRVGPDEFVLQRVSPIFAPEIHENIQRVTQHLAARGFRSVTLLPTVDGASSASLGSLDRWRLMPHLGGASFDRIQSLEQAQSAGRLIGEFHAAMRDFDAPLAPIGIPYRETETVLVVLRGTLENHENHRLAEEVGPLAQRVFEAFDALGPPIEAPDCVIHGDLKLSNLLFESRDGPGRDKAVALIDMDTLMRAPLWVELGDAWRSWCNPAGEEVRKTRFDLSIFESSTKGFLQGLGRPLSTAETESLRTAPERLALELCARYLTDALEESYFGWDPTRFSGHGEHNSTRAIGQWQVFQDSCRSREARQEILDVCQTATDLVGN